MVYLWNNAKTVVSTELCKSASEHGFRFLIKDLKERKWNTHLFKEGDLFPALNVCSHFQQRLDSHLLEILF